MPPRKRYSAESHVPLVISSLLQAGQDPQSFPDFCDQGASEGFRPVTLWTALVWLMDAVLVQNDCILSDGA